ncbi:hypothetical protein T484DRAFT_3008498 [Baffinella frigidus]|nr:hypothetical protein T484DRAFT_3008498 [Cryptophyta sp. CCMP2293]
MAFRVALPLVLAAVSLTDAFLTLPATGSTFVKLAGARSCSPLEGVRRPCAPTLALRRNSQQPLSLNMASPLGLRSKMAGAKKVLATTAMALSLSFMGVQSARAAGGATMYEDDLHEEVQVTEVMPEETDYTGMRTLKFGEQVIKYGMLAGGFGGFLAYSMWEGKRADRDEETRVAEEVRSKVDGFVPRTHHVNLGIVRKGRGDARRRGGGSDREVEGRIHRYGGCGV